MFCWNGRADHGTTCVSKGQRLCSAVLLWFLLCQSQNLSRNKGQDLNLGKNVTWSLLKIFFNCQKQINSLHCFSSCPSLDVRFGFHHPVPSRSRWASVRARLWRGHTLSSALGAPPKKKKRWRPCSVSREREQGCEGCAAQALGEAEKQMRELGLLSLEERRPGDYCSLWLSQRRL